MPSYLMVPNPLKSGPIADSGVKGWTHRASRTEVVPSLSPNNRLQRTDRCAARR
jgi:hypothetical protein